MTRASKLVRDCATAAVWHTANPKVFMALVRCSLSQVPAIFDEHDAIVRTNIVFDNTVTDYPVVYTHCSNGPSMEIMATACRICESIPGQFPPRRSQAHQGWHPAPEYNSPSSSYIPQPTHRLHLRLQFPANFHVTETQHNTPHHDARVSPGPELHQCHHLCTRRLLP